MESKFYIYVDVVKFWNNFKLKVKAIIKMICNIYKIFTKLISS